MSDMNQISSSRSPVGILKKRNQGKMSSLGEIKSPITFNITPVIIENYYSQRQSPEATLNESIAEDLE
jgi:hypothetical protein